MNTMREVQEIKNILNSQKTFCTVLVYKQNVMFSVPIFDCGVGVNMSAIGCRSCGSNPHIPADFFFSCKGIQKGCK